MKRRLRLETVAVAVLIFVTALAVSFPLQAQTFATTSEVNLRQGPSNSDRVLRVLENGERVEKLGEQGGFAQVKTKKDGLIGYVGVQYLTPAAEESSAVPRFEELKSEISRQEPGSSASGPGQYFFEAVLEFVRAKSHPLFVILLPLGVAVALVIAGVILLRAMWPRLEQLLPPTLSSEQKKFLLLTLLVAAIYLFATVALYFLDLALHFSARGNFTALAMTLLVPRVLLAGPVALVDLLVKNWVIGILFLLFIIMLSWRSKEKSQEKGEPAPGSSLPPTTPLREKTPSAIKASVSGSGPVSLPPETPRPSETPSSEEAATKIVAPPVASFPKLPDDHSE